MHGELVWIATDTSRNAPCGTRAAFSPPRSADALVMRFKGKSYRILRSGMGTPCFGDTRLCVARAIRLFLQARSPQGHRVKGSMSATRHDISLGIGEVLLI